MVSIRCGCGITSSSVPGDPFPFFEALFSIALLASHTERVTLGTGVLVLPIRDPVVLAKETATLQFLCGGRLSLGVAAGWYQREFEATGIPFAERGRIFEENLELLRRLWTEESVSGTYSQRQLKDVRMVPRPEPAPSVLIGGYVDRVLRRVAKMGDGWLTYFYTPESFSRAWSKIRSFAEQIERDPDTLTNVAQLPICVDDTYEAADRRVRAFVGEYFDTAAWSESTVESSIRGTPEQCAEQIQRPPRCRCAAHRLRSRRLPHRSGRRHRPRRPPAPRARNWGSPGTLMSDASSSEQGPPVRARPMTDKVTNGR